MREQPHLLVTHIEQLKNKPITFTELVRQTIYLWENGQKELKKTQNLKNLLGPFLRLLSKKSLTHNENST